VDGDAAIVGGYHAPGDGGGGTFAWNSTITTGDNILTIQPTGVFTGAWVRIFDGPVNVKWGGAYGDGDHDDTAAIQAVLNVVLPTVQNPNATDPFLTVYMPSGIYNVTPPMNQPALSINQPTILTGAGAGFTDQATRISCSGYAPATAGSAALAVEGANSAAAGSLIDGIVFVGHGTNIPQDLVVIHASNVTVSNCGFSNCWRYGICGSSGLTGTGSVDSALGVSSMPGNNVNAHFAQIINCDAQECGSIVPTLGGGESTLQVQVTANFTQPAIGSNVTVQVNTTAPFTWDAQNPHPIGVLQLGAFGTDMYAIQSVVDDTHVIVQNVGAADSSAATVTPTGTSFGNGLWFNIGAGMIVYGVDANGWNVVAFNSGNCCNGTIAFPQGSATFSACYAQGTYYPHVDGAAGAEVYVSCGQETIAQCILQIGAQILVVGGSCATSLKGGGNGYPGILSPTISNFAFSQNDPDGAVYTFVPSIHETFMGMERNFPGESPHQSWSFKYQQVSDSGTWSGPFHLNSWIWFATSIAFPLTGQAPFTPLGFTDTQNQRGTGLPFISTPTMNAPMHFAWKQAVTLVPGANTVYLNGGTTGDAGAVAFLTDPTSILMGQPVFKGGPANQPAVTFTGTPTQAIAPIEVIIQSSTTFEWFLNGVLQASGVTIASAVVLGATGITANFPAGTYVAAQTFTGYSQWGNAERKMRIDLEFASAALATANCQVVGYAFVSEGSGTYNAACQILNNAGSPVAATVVWTYDVFVTNYATASGSIG
jgi:hypothetical protein